MNDTAHFQSLIAHFVDQYVGRAANREFPGAPGSPSASHHWLLAQCKKRGVESRDNTIGCIGVIKRDKGQNLVPTAGRLDRPICPQAALFFIERRNLADLAFN